MVNIILSPCLFMRDGEIKNLGELSEILDFALRLDVKWDMIESSLLCEENWFSFPQYKPMIYNQFCLITKKLKQINKFGTIVSVAKNSVDFFINSKYIITDDDEFQCLLKYIDHSTDEMLLFVSKLNKDIGDTLSLSIRNKRINISSICEPYLEKRNIFDKYIRQDTKNNLRIFKNWDLCGQLDKLMQEEAKNISGISKGTHYKKYGKIIAYRNGFVDYPVPDPYEPDTDYYIRNDKKYIISIDLLHGLFEVFYGNNELWFAEYNFSGEEIFAPTDKKELDKARQNHRIRKRHR